MPTDPTPLTEHVPTLLRGQDGEPPIYVNQACADTPAAAVAFARDQGEYVPDEISIKEDVWAVLMRELDPIACRVRGVEYPWWVECTPRAKKAVGFWRIDA